MADARRRRWLPLAELVGLLGVVIAALGLWTSWSDRRADTAARAAAEASVARVQGRVDLVATPRRDGRELLLRDPRHELQDVVIAFPRALGVTPQHPLADPVIDAEPLRDALLKDNDARGGRVPVLVTTRVLVGDAARTATMMYDLVWVTESRFLRGRSLKLVALRLRQRGGSQASVDAAWAKVKPARAG